MKTYDVTNPSGANMKWKHGGITKAGIYFNHQRYRLTWRGYFELVTKWFWFRIQYPRIEAGTIHHD